MSEPKVIAAYVVELLDDGSMRHVGFDVRDDPAVADSHAEALETIQATFPGSTVIDPSASPSGPSIAEQIKAAQDHEDLATVWRANKDEWTAEHNKLAANRKKEFGK